ncbi:dethiobiotin synthase [Leptospira alstonii]|uniref:dethiobiotin synthase n=1 Tax=Leptospira alstonii TaxID=28452 RepID=UPI000772EBE8|nr:dethiobiotin synthase [Leptospira alstonii]
MAVFIGATGTDVGKTFFSSLILGKYGKSLGLKYFKPVQTGNDSDRVTMMQLTGLHESYFLKNYYSLAFAGSPHYSSELEGVEIDSDELSRHLYSIRDEKIIVEGAGGLLVPLTRKTLTLEVIRQSEIPLILVAPVSLGAINQTLLSIEAARNRNIDLKGIYFIGIPDRTTNDNIRTITELSGTVCLGNFFLNSKEKISRERFQNEYLPQFDSEECVKKILL